MLVTFSNSSKKVKSLKTEMPQPAYNVVIDVALIRLFVSRAVGEVAKAVIDCPTNKSICDKYVLCGVGYKIDNS